MEEFLRGLPKAELHVHIEGTIEPELVFELAARNAVTVPFGSVDEMRAAFEFANLEEFLDVYYAAAAVLVTAQDFYDLTSAYLKRAAADGVRRAEIFLDPQTHTQRGIPIGLVIEGVTGAMSDHRSDHRIDSALIPCFLRHLGPAAAMASFDELLPFRSDFIGIGLDSSEVGWPPVVFADLYDRARAEGLRLVGHAGEEGPPAFVWEALDILGVERVDHGVQSIHDVDLVARLAADGTPLTMCPLSNVRLKVVDRIEDHPLARMLAAGVKVTINSDDPSFFGGYVGANYVAVQDGLGLDRDAMVGLALNSVDASFAADDVKQGLRDEVADYEANWAR